MLIEEPATTGGSHPPAALPRPGLDDAEAAHLLAVHGPNALPTVRGPGMLRQLGAQFVHFFALILWAAAGLAWIGGMPALAVAIAVVVLINGVFSFIQEARAERATRALAALLPTSATVLRNGRRRTIPAIELVPGDVLLVAEGDHISADADVLEDHELRVDMSLLTGESDPVPVGDRMLAGTYAVSGSGIGVVATTGGDTRLGSLSALTGDVHRRPAPLRIELDRAVRLIAVVALASGVVFFGAAVLLGMPAADGFLFAVGVIVALVPEGLLPTLTLSLAMSASRMARRGALVRHLEAVETLGATTVICTDKTGTLTANQMTAAAIVRRGRRYMVTGSGYGSTVGIIERDGRPLDEAVLAGLWPLLDAAALCGNARIEGTAGREHVVGDPSEAALEVLARKGDRRREDLERRTPRVVEFPFTADRRRMTTVHRRPDGTVDVLVKGSPESVIARCANIDRAGALSDADALAGDGLRVLALARRVMAAVPARAEEAERDLELLGLVGLRDPMRPEVPEAIARCRGAGIRVVMLTGDHPATAGAIARSSGLSDSTILIGDELPADDAALAALLATPTAIVARVSPEQKLRIARALQSAGDVVAMTGDGVNDAPALRQADIGIAMGIAGTDVARAAADIVLLDDSFAHIVEAVEEGRAAFDNIRRFLTYHLTDNVAELAPFALWALSGGSFPLVLSVLQILALDIGTDLLPAVALGGEPPTAGTMAKPPRKRGAPVLDAGVLGRAFVFLGPIEAVLSLALVPIGAVLFLDWRPGDGLPHDGRDLALLSTLVFAAIVAMQMANALSCRSTSDSVFIRGVRSNRLLQVAIAFELLALVASVYVPGLNDALGQVPLGLSAWLIVLPLPFVFLALEETRKLVVRRRAAASSPDGKAEGDRRRSPDGARAARS